MKRTIKKRNRKNRKSRKIYGGECRSGYVKDLNNTEICCDGIAKYYEHVLEKLEKNTKGEVETSQINSELRKLAGDCTNRKFLDERKQFIKKSRTNSRSRTHSGTEYAKMDEYFKTLEAQKHLQNMVESRKKTPLSKSILRNIQSVFHF
jgi:chaperonin GroEL (HSP60 family)